ncbi:MAG: hypothetical protein RLZZ175_1760 [Bacteroidota bacterium]|jgi:two-component system phosphate regulon sensor histidine kinase PhoR
MKFSSRGVAILLALLIATLTTAFLSLIPTVGTVPLVVCFGMSFATSFVLIYLTFEFLIFREINNVYRLIDKLKKKEFGIAGKAIKKSTDPISRIKQEIYTLAKIKQLEIDELKKLEQYRREFIADVSHELKTPIFAAQGFVETLLDGAMDDENVRDKFLQKASKSLDSLTHLVEDLIALSQLEIGEVKMEFQELNLEFKAKEAIEQLEDKASKRNIKLKLTTKGDAPFKVHADNFRIQQVLTNLIDNAIKYGNDDGHVEVILEKDKSGVQVTIKDDGPGIPAEHLPRLFERFYRVEKSRNKEKGGTGLGLAIVEKIIEAHQSSISVSSKFGKGTSFTFKLK